MSYAINITYASEFINYTSLQYYANKGCAVQGYCETEDYERTILYFLKYGQVYRYRGAGVQTKYQGTSGGGRKGFATRKGLAVTYLLTKYPELCFYRDKSGEPDILLNWRALPLLD